MLRKEVVFGVPKYLCEYLSRLVFDPCPSGVLEALPFSGHSGLGHKSVKTGKVFAYRLGAGKQNTSV